MALPKQFLPLVSEHTLFQETLLRLRGFPGLAPPLVVCNNEHRFLAAEQLHAIQSAPLLQILEPVGRNTAPAVAIAAFAAQDKDAQAVLLVLPADHLIQDIPRTSRLPQRNPVCAQPGATGQAGYLRHHPQCTCHRIRLHRTWNQLGTDEHTFSVARFVKSRIWILRKNSWPRVISSGTVACSCSRPGCI
ncbi:MAG: sugar phosphate nucleotidyltransferase [Nitrosomonadales bacterium]